MDENPHEPQDGAQGPDDAGFGGDLPIDPGEPRREVPVVPGVADAPMGAGAPHEPTLPPPPDRREGFFGDVFQVRYREVTVSAMIFAIIVGVIMNAAITYAGLKIGFTIGGSAIAAVLGFGVLRGVLRKGSILETNVAQTVASAVNTSNSGVIFTVPVLLLMGGFNLAIDGPDFWYITLACVGGAMLGTAFIVPLRKQMLDIERLRFPSPTGVAMILKSPGAGTAKAVVLVLGILLGALIYAPAGLPSLTRTADPADGQTLEDKLVEMFDAEKIDWATAERTMRMAAWIESESAPDGLAELGAVYAAEQHAQLTLNETGHGDLDVLQQRISELQAAREAVTATQAAYPDVADEDVALAIAVHHATTGAGEWSDLQDKALGWAAEPLWGYSDAEWRLPIEPNTDFAGTTSDLDGRAETTEERLTVRVDRNQDGRADRLMTDDSIDVGRALGLPDEIQLIFAIAPFALGAGYITGRAGLFVLAGGILAFCVINPVAYNMGWMPGGLQAHEAAGFGFGSINRPLGIGLLLGGALMGVLFSLPSIKEALKSIALAGKLKGGGDELGIKTILVAVMLGLVALYFAASYALDRPLNEGGMCLVTEQPVSDQVEVAEYEGYKIAFASEDARTEWMSWDETKQTETLREADAKPGWLHKMDDTVSAIIIAVIGAVWIWFAGIIIAQCAGMTDWSPISGLALLTVVLVLLLSGTGAVVGAVLVGAALCVAITLAADMMGDLKTGYLVGAKPKRQQVAELSVVWMGPIICMFTLLLIAASNDKLYGIQMGPGTPTSAPQAQALQAVITGVQGGEMPYMLYGLGSLFGALLGLSAFPGLGVLVGLSMYLPFKYIATYGVGCVVNILVGWIFGRRRAEEWGVPFCAGLIVGESLLALIINIIVLVGG